MTITGRIIKVMPATTGISKQGNSWSKQEYIIETIERYPKQICIEAMGDNIAKMNLQEGIVYTIDFDMSSREYNGRYYTTVTAWRAQQAQP